jgi:hypothetical protein
MSQSNILDVVRTRRFELVDDDGKTRVEMSTDKDFVLMRFLDQNGHIKMNIGLGRYGQPNVSLAYRDGLPRIGLFVRDDGTSALEMFSGSFAKVSGSDTANLRIMASADGSRIEIRLTDNVSTQIVLGLAESSPMLVVLRDGHAIWSAT